MLVAWERIVSKVKQYFDGNSRKLTRRNQRGREIAMKNKAKKEIVKHPRKDTSHPPTAIRIIFKEYKTEIHQFSFIHKVKILYADGRLNFIACASLIE